MGFMDRLKGAAEATQAQTSKLGIGASADQMVLANRGKRLMDHGIETPAHIDSMSATGKTDAPGGSEHMVTVTVTPAAGESRAATFNQYIYPAAPFTAGDDVMVRVDPDDASSLMLWGTR
jgi:hypothetical protein